MKSMRRLILFPLAALLLLIALPIGASAVETTGWYWPVPDSTSLSRGYFNGHFGIDITSTRDVNETIVAARDGTVMAVFEGCNLWNGYGQNHAGCNPVAHVQGRNDLWGIRYYQQDGGTEVCNYGFGRGVVIDHGGGVWTHYAHMASVSVSVGQSVHGGDPIGTMGAYGNADGRHLHFEIREDSYINSGSAYPNGTAVNSNPQGAEYIIYGSWNQIDNIWYSRDYTRTAALDVNGLLDGTLDGGLGGYGVFDMYVGGSLVSSGTGDYCNASVKVGTSYQVANIRANSGYRYNGLASGSSAASGTLTESGANIVLSFSKVKPTALALQDSLTVQAGRSFTLPVTWTPSDTHSDFRGVTWTSSDESVATVDAGGKVTGVAEGTATVTAVSAYSSRFTASCAVTVTKAIPVPEITAVDVDGYSVHVAWTASEPVDAGDQRTYTVRMYRSYSYPLLAETGLTDTFFDTTLPGPGTYRVTVAAVNAANGESSTVASRTFSVDWVLTGEWQTSNTLPSNVTHETCDIEYQHTYRTTAQSSPGSGWSQVSGSAVTTYENTGGIWETEYPQQTSDTLLLVGQYYYHWCGASTGSDAEHHQIGNYTDRHVAGSLDGYDVVYSHTDYQDPSLTFYQLRNRTGPWAGEAALCAAERTDYWYIMNQYQARTAVTTWTWTKTDDWTDVKDSGAYSIRYRFRLKDTLAPTVDCLRVTAITPRDITLLCGVSDDTGIAKLVFRSWADGEDESAAVEREITVENAPLTAEVAATVAIADHGSAKDVFYNTTVLVYDVRGNVTEYAGDEGRAYMPLLIRNASRRLVLPAGLLTVEAGAFDGDVGFGEVILPDSLTTIGARAFAECGRMTLIHMPDSVTDIAPDAFADSDNVVFLCASDNAAAAYARSRAIPYFTGE